ncbi:MAG: DNA-directed RNA polymerase subunit omega [Acidobacteriia bacterium]|nr:DNA-directed RNA polymerase subunit omega [Terriglobia bacterium]
MELPTNLDSKFRFILVAAKRARQLQAGAKPLIQSASKRPTRVAQQEVGAGLVPVEVMSANSNHNDKNKKAKSGK